MTFMITSINLLYLSLIRKSGELTSIVVNDVANMRVALGASYKLFVEPINIIVLITILFIINIKLALLCSSYYSNYIFYNNLDR